MGSIIWLAVSITVMSEPNMDGTPQVMVVPQRYYETVEQCEKWRRDRYQNPWGSVDPVTGQAVIAYFYECTVQFADEVQGNIAPFVSKN